MKLIKFVLNSAIEIDKIYQADVDIVLAFQYGSFGTHTFSKNMLCGMNGPFSVRISKWANTNWLRILNLIVMHRECISACIRQQ